MELNGKRSNSSVLLDAIVVKPKESGTGAIDDMQTTPRKLTPIEQINLINTLDNNENNYKKMLLSGLKSESKLNTMHKSEHQIDLRKEFVSEEVIPESIVITNEDVIKLQKELLDVLYKIKPMRVSDGKHKHIDISIDMKLIDGDENFLEKLKLTLLSEINEIIGESRSHTKNPSGFTINKVNITTEINCK